VGGVGATMRTGGDAVAVRQQGRGDMQCQMGSSGNSRGYDRDSNRGDRARDRRTQQRHENQHCANKNKQHMHVAW
jgi:hypothetical protein